MENIKESEMFLRILEKLSNRSDINEENYMEVIKENLEQVVCQAYIESNEFYNKLHNDTLTNPNSICSKMGKDIYDNINRLKSA